MFTLLKEVRTQFDLMKSDNEGQVSAKQALQMAAHDRRAKERELTIGQEVMARNYRDGDNWNSSRKEGSLVVHSTNKIRCYLETTH